jgi:predicted ATP-grasp superfamily ATP-dependent carboligase
MDIFGSDKNVAIVLGCHINGLGIIRSLGQNGIPVLGLDCEKSIGLSSKYCYPMPCPNPLLDKEGFIDFFKAVVKKFKKKPVLFPTKDEWLIAISEYRRELEEYCFYPMSDWDVIRKCVDKKLMYKEAEKIGIPIPKTVIINDEMKFDDEMLDELEYPIIIKGAIPSQFLQGFKIKTILLRDRSELDKWIKDNYEILRNKSINALIQEVIPGDVSNLYTFSSYSNTNANIVAFSIIQKTIQEPPDFGTIVVGQVIRIPEIIELGTQIIKGMGFYGLSNTEFKYDSKDGKYKLMEINPRSGKSIYYTTMCGVNQPYLAYSEAIGEKIEFQEPLEGDYGKEWIVLPEYFLCKLKDIIRGKKRKILRNKSKKIYAVCSFNDPIPGLLLIYEILALAVKKVI